MDKKNLSILVLTGMFLVALGYVIYLKQEVISQTERAFDARIEALEYKKMAQVEAIRAEKLAVEAIEAQTEAERQKEIALEALEAAKRQAASAKRNSQ